MDSFLTLPLDPATLHKKILAQEYARGMTNLSLEEKQAYASYVTGTISLFGNDYLKYGSTPYTSKNGKIIDR